MSYIEKVISPNEKLIGIARLHWIYILQGALWFCVCMGLSRFLNMAMIYILVSASTLLKRDYSSTFTGIPYIMPLMLAVGSLIFLIYLTKVMTTEIGLTSSRVIRKQGFLFVKAHDVSIEEIRGDYLDLGWFGRILGYGYINLDCRLVGDIRTPAIEKPERFMQALQQIRSQITDNLSLGGGARPVVTMEELEEDRKTFAEDRKELNAGQEPVDAKPQSTPPSSPPVQQAAPAAPQPIVVQVASAAAPDAAMVAKIVEQAMPQIVEKVAEEMAAKGLVPGQAAAESEDDLLKSFNKDALH